jgi:hypothetical protein
MQSMTANIWMMAYSIIEQTISWPMSSCMSSPSPSYSSYHPEHVLVFLPAVYKTTLPLSLPIPPTSTSSMHSFLSAAADAAAAAKKTTTTTTTRPLNKSRRQFSRHRIRYHHHYHLLTSTNLRLGSCGGGRPSSLEPLSMSS